MHVAAFRREPLGNAESDARAENGFSLLHRTEDLGEGSSRALHQMASQLRDDAGLVTRGQPYLTEIWSDPDWRLYAVSDPEPIVAPPAL